MRIPLIWDTPRDKVSFLTFVVIPCMLALALFATGCSSIRYVTVIHGQVYTQHHEPVNIVGNPPLICTDVQTQRTFSGYFIRQDDDGTILLDHFGKGTIFLRGDLTCELKLDASSEK